MKHRDGRWVWVLDRGKVMSRTEDGKPLLVMGTHLDISDQKRTEENHLLLTSGAAQLQAFGPDTMDYKSIIERARKLSGASFGALNLFDRDGRSFTTVALAGVPESIEKAASLLGFPLIGRTWSHDPARETALGGERSALFPSLGALTKGVISGTAVKLIEKSFGLGEVLVVRVSREARDLGDFTLFFTRDSSLQNQMLLEMYAEMVGITLSRIEVEKENLDLLHEKETLLKEVQHRIKNNMNTMTSLLSLQEQAMQDPAAAAVLNDARSRFRSMEVLYDQLYRGESYEGGSVVEYLKDLVPQVVDLFPNASGVKVRVHSGSEKKGSRKNGILKASVLSALGLMVNELVTNAMKYAFADRGGTLEVSIDCSNPLVEISIADDGPGMPESIDPDKPSGFGLTMVRALAEQLDGTVSFASREKRGGGGTEIIIRFPRGERHEKK
jgi:two-component sensor histidine kinase